MYSFFESLRWVWIVFQLHPTPHLLRSRLFGQQREGSGRLRNNITDVMVKDSNIAECVWSACSAFAHVVGDLRCHRADSVKSCQWFNPRSWAKRWVFSFGLDRWRGRSSLTPAGGCLPSSRDIDKDVYVMCAWMCSDILSRCVFDPEVSVTASCRTDDHSWWCVSILRYVTLSSVSLASESSLWRFCNLTGSSICWHDIQYHAENTQLQAKNSWGRSFDYRGIIKTHLQKSLLNWWYTKVPRHWKKTPIYLHYAIKSLHAIQYGTESKHHYSLFSYFYLFPSTWASGSF